MYAASDDPCSLGAAPMIPNEILSRIIHGWQLAPLIDQGQGIYDLPRIKLSIKINGFSFGKQCHSRYDRNLGFRSSRQPLTSSEHHHECTPDTSSLVDKETLRNHCEGNQPTDLIALSDSPSRILSKVGILMT